MSVSDKEWLPCYLHTPSDGELITIRSSKAKLDCSLPRKFGNIFWLTVPVFSLFQAPFLLRVGPVFSGHAINM